MKHKYLLIILAGVGFSAAGCQAKKPDAQQTTIETLPDVTASETTVIPQNAPVEETPVPTEETPVNDAEHPAQLENSDADIKIAPSSAEANAEPAVPDIPAETGPCKYAGIPEDDKCVCGTMKLLAAEAISWVCIDNYWLCLQKEGCKKDAVVYPAYSEIRDNKVYCEKEGALKKMEGYACEDGRWICNQDNCDCQGDTVLKDTHCTIKGYFIKYYPNDNNYYSSYYTLNHHGEEYCGGVSLKRFMASNPETADKNIDRSQFICHNDKWEYQSIPYACIQKDGVKQWVKADELQDRSSEFCHGISDQEVGNEVACVGQKNWICLRNEGCECKAVNGTKKIPFGQPCIPEDHCQNAVLPPGGAAYTKGDEYCSASLIGESCWWYLNDFNCMAGDCACGDGSCPRFGSCSSDGQCECHGWQIGNDYGEFECEPFERGPRNDDDMTELGGLLVCSNSAGCRTKDGRHFNAGSVIGHNISPSYHPDYTMDQFEESIGLMESWQFHVDGGTDTTQESRSILGECVLDASTSESDLTQLAHIPFCYSNTVEGQRGYLNPDNPKECIYPTDWAEPNYHIGGFSDGDEIIYREKSVKIYDVEKCEGGHRYCHGINNAPILIPEDSKGYQCLSVFSLPENPATQNIKAWVCTSPDGCKCGETKCAVENACIDGQCVDVGRNNCKNYGCTENTINVKQERCLGQKLRKGYECVVDASAHSGQTCKEDSCKCGSIRCSRNSVCTQDNVCLCAGEQMPTEGKFICDTDGWECSDEAGCSCMGKHIDSGTICHTCYAGQVKAEGCYCGDHLMAPGFDCRKVRNEYQEICFEPTGCACGNTYCPASTVCKDSQCIDPLSGASITDNPDPHTLTPSLRCSQDTCACGNNACVNGEFCAGGICYPHFWATIIKDHRVVYNYFDVLRYFAWDIDRINEEPNPYVDADSANKIRLYVKDHPLDANLIEKNKSMWTRGIILYTKTDCSYFGTDSSEPESYAVSHFVSYIGECCGGFHLELNHSVRETCALADGCPCGKQTCLYGGECIKGKCSYKGDYSQIWCGDGTVDEHGECICRGMKLPPQLSADYTCESDGWHCKAQTCRCGSVNCSKDKVCATPNVCVAPIPKT